MICQLSFSLCHPPQREPSTSIHREGPMRAYRIHEFGGPEALRREDLPSPSPGPGQVLVRVKAASIISHDVLVTRGVYSRNLPLPLIHLSDASGEVERGRGEIAAVSAPGDEQVAVVERGRLDPD